MGGAHVVFSQIKQRKAFLCHTLRLTFISLHLVFTPINTNVNCQAESVHTCICCICICWLGSWACIGTIMAPYPPIWETGI